MSCGSKDIFKNASYLIELIVIMTSEIWLIMGWLKIQEHEYLGNRTKLFYEIKDILTCSSDGTFSDVISL